MNGMMKYGFDFGWFIGFILIVIVIWLTIKVVNQKKQLKSNK